MLGTAIGIYVAQNYDVPSIRELAHSYIMNAKHIEETYRKPQKSGDSKGNSQWLIFFFFKYTYMCYVDND